MDAEGKMELFEVSIVPNEFIFEGNLTSRGLSPLSALHDESQNRSER